MKFLDSTVIFYCFFILMNGKTRINKQIINFVIIEGNNSNDYEDKNTSSYVDSQFKFMIYNIITSGCDDYKIQQISQEDYFLNIDSTNEFFYTLFYNKYLNNNKILNHFFDLTDPSVNKAVKSFCRLTSPIANKNKESIFALDNLIRKLYESLKITPGCSIDLDFIKVVLISFVEAIANFFHDKRNEKISMLKSYAICGEKKDLNNITKLFINEKKIYKSVETRFSKRFVDGNLNLSKLMTAIKDEFQNKDISDGEVSYIFVMKFEIDKIILKKMLDFSEKHVNLEMDEISLLENYKKIADNLYQEMTKKTDIDWLNKHMKKLKNLKFVKFAITGISMDDIKERLSFFNEIRGVKNFLIKEKIARMLHKWMIQILKPYESFLLKLYNSLDESIGLKNELVLSTKNDQKDDLNKLRKNSEKNKEIESLSGKKKIRNVCLFDFYCDVKVTKKLILEKLSLKNTMVLNYLEPKLFYKGYYKIQETDE